MLLPAMHAEAFPLWVETYYAPLYRFALSLSRNATDAADLTQQTFFLLASNQESLRDSAKVKSWLFTTLYREFLRGRRREARVTVTDDVESERSEGPEIEPEAIARLDAERVMLALQELPAAYREPVTLFYLQDLSYLEIAEVLSLPVGTVMSRLSRGKALLRTRLAQGEQQGKVISFPSTGTH
ncbi:MAG TPA: RNA polymerase sigma factor [Opitutaceae bacterium]|nr:RNA polymerase sigma factor [Opitutaceae bacterium]